MYILQYRSVIILIPKSVNAADLTIYRHIYIESHLPKLLKYNVF